MTGSESRVQSLPHALPLLNPAAEVAEDATTGGDDLSQQPEMKGLDLPLRLPARALLVVPLITDGKSIGSITCARRTSPVDGRRRRLN